MTTFTVRTTCGTERDFDTRREAEDALATHVSLCEECDEDDARVRMRADESERPPVRPAGQRSLVETVEPAESNGGGRRREPAAPTRDAPTEGVPAGGVPAEAAPAAETRADGTPADAAPTTEGDGSRTGDPAATGGAEVGLPDLPDSIRADPLDVVPSYMITEVEGQPTINKRGYAVIASHFDIVVRAEPITTAGETDHEYAEFAARAWRKEDGPENAYTGHATARASEERRGVADNLNEMAETRAMKRAVAWASGVGILAYEEMAGYLDGDG